MGQPSVLETIGNTPLLHLEGVWVKCEFMNPSGSIKARVAKHLVEQAERKGLLHKGDTLVEATSGNMGNALAMVAAAKGYPCLIFTPQGFSPERTAISQAFGAEVRIVGDFHLIQAVKEAKALGKQPGYYCTSQFDNPENLVENRTWLAEEILAQLPPNISLDAIVQGVGTGGTLIGVSQALKAQHNAEIKVIAVEPSESPTLQTGAIAHHHIEGISDGFVPALFSTHRAEVDDIIAIPSGEAIAAMRHLASTHGLFVGPSSGANWLAAALVKKRYPEVRHLLTFFCDEGEKYLQQYF